MHVNFYDLAMIGREQRANLCRRAGVDFGNLIAKVAPLVNQVRWFGDDAVRELTQKFDGVDLDPSEFRVKAEDLNRAAEEVSREVLEAMQVSLANIRKFHERQVEPSAWETTIMPGLVAGERVVPIPSVGLYVPRGKGSFPSMMMMAGVPAKVAGVQRIVVVSPPDLNGKVDTATLAAAQLVGIQEIYAIGGVQAIAALAYGTETIPRVHKIVGPGSGYVLAAKQLVGSHVDTGLPAGPSEAIILCDSTADPFMAVTDLLIEAEHGPDSSAYLVTPDASIASQALKLVPEMVSELPEDRRLFCQEVFSSNGGIVLAQGMDDAVDFVNEFAPEHLQILTRNPREILDTIKFAGESLLGYYTPGSLANYSIGPNAILPTSGFATTASGLSVRDFTRRMSFSIANETGFMNLAPSALILADYEGFAAHAQALRKRLRMQTGVNSHHETIENKTS